MKNVINIVNFIRGLEPRRPDDDLTIPVKHQIELAYKYNLPMTFLYQYDALADPRFLNLLKDNKDFEIGLWFECPKCLVENAGLLWRGREGFDWDPHTHVDMLVGYTTEERKLLIDEAMRFFKEIFGYYPKTVGSWILDAFSIDYMTEKYGISAALICKEQWGTDGYSLWGGYYSEAYYPSKTNMLCPGQSEGNTIKTPVFRMLGTDPIRQYMNGIGTNLQKVDSMEPSYPASGADREWVQWFLDKVMCEKNLGFNYCQAGQENSFGWEAMKEGYLLQMELFKEKEKKGEIEFLTVSETAEKFKEKYGETPCTSTTVSNGDTSASWFSSKFYRAGIYKKGESVFVRDIFRFDEKYREKYLNEVTTNERCCFDNLPVIDCFRWSTEEKIGGGYFRKGGKLLKSTGEILGEKISEGCLKVTVPTDEGNIFVTFNEKSINFEFPENGFNLNVLRYKNLTWPEVKAENGKINLLYNGFDYSIEITGAECKVNDNGYCITAENSSFELKF